VGLLEVQVGDLWTLLWDDLFVADKNMHL
jgi:hypothetical protein